MLLDNGVFIISLRLVSEISGLPNIFYIVLLIVGFGMLLTYL